MIDGLKIGLLINGSYGGMEPGDICTDLRGLGYDAIEPIWAPGGIKEQKRIAEDAGLEISEIVLQKDYITRDPREAENNIQLSIQCMEECAEAGVGVVNVFTGPAPWIPDPVVVGRDITPSEAWGRLFKAFDILVPAAEGLGVEMALEGVWCHLCHDFFTSVFLIDHYRSNAFGVNFDPSHDVISGNTDMSFLIKSWGSRIKHIHLKDAAGVMVPGRFIYPLLGEGFVDWTAFRRALDEIGYKGVCSVEFESDGYTRYYAGMDLRNSAIASMNALRQLIKKENQF